MNYEFEVLHWIMNVFFVVLHLFLFSVVHVIDFFVVLFMMSVDFQT